jgi:isoleucyl-tRNA synthetase
MFLVNSPVVRGDNLRFREEGVRDVIARVLLPWLNSFRFFMGHAALLKKTTGHDFYYNAHAPLPTNVMDRWILARCQSLIKLVREEMAVYRLYTIIPRLLALIDELTNWYIRFNRKRLKGEDGKDDTIAALNTLFETLFTLCRTMVSSVGYSRSEPETFFSSPRIHRSSQRISTSRSRNSSQKILTLATHALSISSCSQRSKRSTLMPTSNAK